MEDLINISDTNKCDVMVINYWFAVNYGASLTCYGVQYLLEKLGKKVKIINYVPNFSAKLNYKDSFAQEFAQKYLHLTTPCSSYEDFIKLNDSCKTFVTGSDQVFSPKIMKSHHTHVTQSIYLLDFVKSSGKKISFAASLGDIEDNFTPEDIGLFKHFLTQFDGISVREYPAKEFINKEFNLDAVQLIDAAFYIPIEVINKMADKNSQEGEYVAYYKLPYWDFEWQDEFAQKISRELNIPLKVFEFNQTTPVEDWLSFIKNSKFVVTNSYHAVIFAIRFNIPFVQLAGRASQSRFESLYKILNTPNNSCYELNGYNPEKLFVNRNWDEINRIIDFEVTKAENWAKNVLDCPNTDKSEYDSLNYLCVHNQLSIERLNSANKSLSAKLKKLEKQNSANKELLNILSDKNRVILKYYRYKILSKISFGKSRKHYKDKYAKQKLLVKRIRTFVNSLK